MFVINHGIEKITYLTKLILLKHTTLHETVEHYFKYPIISSFIKIDWQAMNLKRHCGVYRCIDTEFHKLVQNDAL